MKSAILKYLIFCLLFCSSTVWAETATQAENDLQALLAQKAQLEAEMAQLEAEIAKAQEDDIIALATEEIKEYWKKEYTEKAYGDGYLGIRYTRVVYIQDGMDLPKTEMFDGMICFVEFMLLTDYFESAPYYTRAGRNECVALLSDGTFSVLGMNPLENYRGRTYSTDYSGIISDISDRGADFNGDYWLLDQ